MKRLLTLLATLSWPPLVALHAADNPEPKPREGVTPLPEGKEANKKRAKKSADTAAAGEDRSARFGKRDKDQDGRISREEFMNTLSDPDPVAGGARFKKLDINKDGCLTKEEFLGTGARE